MSKNSVIFFAVVSALCAGIVPFPTHAASVMVDIPEHYQTVKAGDRVYFQIEFLYPENTRRRDFRFSYAVRTNSEDVVTSEFLKAVETQASFVDYAIVPENTSAGLHTVSLRITDDTGKEIATDVSASFMVLPHFDWAMAHFYMLLAAILVVGGSLSLQLRSIKTSIAR